MLMRSPIAIKEFPEKGRGICTLVGVAAGTLLDSAPVLVVPDSERRRIEQTCLRHYYFFWDEESDEVWRAAVALGPISLCNHSQRPNARFVLQRQELRIDLIAIASIAAGQEITIDYDCDLWFDIKD